MPDIRVQMIRNARLRLGEAPRQVDPADPYLRVRRPLLAIGLSSGHKAAYERFGSLLAQGQVVWASLVVAQNELFSRGNQDGWAVATYSPLLHVHDNLDGVAEASQAIDKLRERRDLGSSELKLQKKIQKVGTWFPPEALPESVSPRQDIEVTSLLVFRKHLPEARLAAGSFPVLTSTGIDGIAILPERYWTPDMRAAWTGG